MTGSEANPQGRLILFGRVLGALGLRGELKIESYSDPRQAIFRYPTWILKRGEKTTPAIPQSQVAWVLDLLRTGSAELQGVKGKDNGKNIIVRFDGVDDRTEAERLNGLDIYIPRSALPPPQPDEYYWVDLEGMDVVTVEGVKLGKISHLFATGANDVVAVRDDSRERLIPFVQPQFVTKIDFDANTMTVDWDPEF